MGTIDENCWEDEKHAGSPIGQIATRIFYAYNLVHKIGGDEIEEDREELYCGNPGEDGVKQCGAGKKIPKRGRVPD